MMETKPFDAMRYIRNPEEFHAFIAEYTSAVRAAALAEGRLVGLEEAAKVCEDLGDRGYKNYSGDVYAGSIRRESRSWNIHAKQ